MAKKPLAIVSECRTQDADARAATVVVSVICCCCSCNFNCRFSLISQYFALDVGHFCMGFLALALFFNYRCLKAASASASA